MKHVIRIIAWVTIATMILLIGVSEAGFDLVALNAQVQHHAAVLDNHEARITNAEGDIKTLQDNTNTPAAPDRVIVQEVPAPAPQPATVEAAPVPAPTPPAPAPTPEPVYPPGFSN